MSVRHPTPWRIGTKVARNIYDANDVGVMMADDEETALEIVQAVNAVEALRWYADPKNYEGHAIGYDWGSSIDLDRGEKARNVLASASVSNNRIAELEEQVAKYKPFYDAYYK